MKETKSFRNKQYLDRIQDAKMMKITRPNSLDYKSLSVSDQDEEIFLNAIHRTKKFDFSCCTSDNSFSISITDALQNQVFTIKRKSVCCAYVPCFSCCRIRSQDVIVETSNGELMGTVSDISSFCTTRYEIQSSDEQKLYLIQNGDDFELRHKFNNKFLGITSRSPRHPRQTYDYYMLSCKILCFNVNFLLFISSCLP